MAAWVASHGTDFPAEGLGRNEVQRTTLGQRDTKCGPQIGSTNDTGEFGRNAPSLATPKPTESEVGA